MEISWILYIYYRPNQEQILIEDAQNPGAW
jgi:hypothetical protein